MDNHPFFCYRIRVLTAVAVSMLSFIAPLALTFLIPILVFVFISETAISIYFFKDTVPDTLIKLFVHNIFEDLSNFKKILLAIGILSALGAGVALSATTFTSAMAATISVLGFFSITCPPLAFVLAAALAIAGLLQ